MSSQMDMKEKDQIAQERYGKPFAELTTNEQKGVGGVHGGHIHYDSPEQREQAHGHHATTTKSKESDE